MRNEMILKAMQSITGSLQQVAMTVIQAIFTVLFPVVLALRWTCEGSFHFFRTDDTGWNCMDVFVVGFNLLGMVLGLALLSEEDSAAKIFRGIAALRVVRGVRIIRVVEVIRIMRFFLVLRL